jgi:hypothetical protein
LEEKSILKSSSFHRAASAKEDRLLGSGEVDTTLHSLSLKRDIYREKSRDLRRHLIIFSSVSVFNCKSASLHCSCQ